MLSGLGLGPVFVFESLVSARRWQVYAGRSLFVAVLLAGMFIVWVTNVPLAFSPGASTFQQMATVGKWFFYALTGIQVSLVLLAAPAAAAGSICMDRMRGTLMHVFVTDLSNREIVLGKLGARLAPVFGLIACALPVTALAALLGGIEYGAIAGAFAVSLSLAALGCALAMTVSVWATKTHEVLMAVFLIEGLWLLALPTWWGLANGTSLAPPPEWFQKANPYVLVFAPYSQPGFVSTGDYAVFGASVLAVSAALTGLVILRLRPTVIAHAGRPDRTSRRWNPAWKRYFPSWPSPTLDGNPVLWREWHRTQPSRLVRRLWFVLLVVTWLLVAWGTYAVIHDGTPESSSGLETALFLQILFGFLMLSATAPTALSEERARGSLDVLLATPLPTRSIVVAKWWGAYRGVLGLTILPLYTGIVIAAAMPSVPGYLATVKGGPPAVPLTSADRVLAAFFCAADFLASGALIVSVGVALATWMRRLSRAVAGSVIAYVLQGIGWPFLVQMLFFAFVFAWSSSGGIGGLENYLWILMCLLSLSPMLGPSMPLSMLQNFPQQQRVWPWIGTGAVVLVKLAVAAALFRFTVATFDRCVGRMPEADARAEHRKRAARKAPVPSEVG